MRGVATWQKKLAAEKIFRRVWSEPHSTAAAAAHSSMDVKRNKGVLGSGRGFKVFHSSLTVTKVRISISHRGHARPHTCLWNDLTAVTQHFHITCLTTCTYRMFLHSWRPAKRSGLQSSSRPTNKAKCQPHWEQLLFEIRLFRFE